jgi:hypothetical protein
MASHSKGHESLYPGQIFSVGVRLSSITQARLTTLRLEILLSAIDKFPVSKVIKYYYLHMI